MKILVTGGNGFIARNLLEQPAEGDEMIGVNRQDLDLMNADQVFSYLKETHFDIVIHTATYDAAPKHSTKDTRKVLENNLRMFFNLARAQDHYGKMIFFGSGAEFGRENWQPKMKEDYFDQHVPVDPYGYSKYLMTLCARSSRNIYNLRLFGVFGEYDDWRTRFISNACCHAAFGLPIRIDQNRSMDFLYIHDLIRIIHGFIKAWPSKKDYNVCSGQSLDLKTIAERIVEMSGQDLAIHIKNPGSGMEYSGDNSALLAEMPNLRLTPFTTALKELYGWYNTHKDSIERDQL